jgi:hypothetical protein
MLHGSENLVLVFQDNAVYMLVRGVDQCLGFFGGPLEYELAGQSCGRRRLHQIASLSLNLLRVLGRPDLIDEIPLVYGMCYDGCRLRYEYDSSKIRILELKPRKSTEAWPYHDYPAILPYCPLALGERRNESWSEFAARFPNLPDQQPAKLVAVVPPPMTLGVSLWGRSGDAEGVAIVFECDIDANRVSTYNVCS